MSVQGVKALEREVCGLVELMFNEEYVKVYIPWHNGEGEILLRRDKLPETKEGVLDLIGTLMTGIPVIGEED